MASKVQIAIALAARAHVKPLQTRAELTYALQHGGVHENNGRPDGLCYWHRMNGRMQTWSTRPADFRQPVKYGLRGYGNITPHNLHEFHAAGTCPVDAAIRAHYASQRGDAQ